MDERVDRPKADFEHFRQSPGPVVVVRRSRLRWVLGLVILLGAGLAGAWFWSTHQATQTAGRGGPGRGAQTPPQPVGAATIDTGDIRIVLNELGTVTSLDTVTVITQISGQLTEVGFKEGQVVKQGDFLAQIDPRPYQAALEQAQGTLAHDQGLLAQAQADLKRYQTLGRQDSIAQQQLEDQHYLVQQYTGTVQTDQGTVDNAKLNLAYCHIVSPIDGQVGLRQVDPGNYVQASSTTGMVVITQMQPISVLFSVPEDNLPDIIQRVRGGATLSVAAYDRANVKLLATGQLATIDNVIDTTTGTLKLRAMFANPDELLYPNQFVNARLLVNTMQNIVRVPVPAVQRGEPGTFVYVINANNTVSVRPVKLGPTDGGYTAVVSGLQPGEKVVTDGTDRLRDGVAVTVPPPAQAKGPGQSGGQSGQAAQPTQPDQGTQPAQPSQAVTPSQPGQPSQPAQPNQTAAPGQPPAQAAPPDQTQPQSEQHQRGQHRPPQSQSQ
ncbi:MAG: MdtA/MuxA family multidrug efflux RND transporter periplasmic adaptor subunit [Acetobacteraceae bacterium]|jgi:multidrug efflux system membrane fusion protein